MIRRAILPAIVFVTLAACGGPGRPMRVVIPQRATMRVAAESLAAHDVIASARLFGLYAKLRGGDRTIKAGTYQLPRSAKWSFVLDALRSGRGLVAQVTIPEGWELRQVIPQLALHLGVPRDSVEAAVRDTALLHELDVPTPTLEGYLFPDTYVFADGATARDAVRLMVRRFEQEWQPAWTARLDTLGMSRHDVMTLASLVEREARKPEERPVIAAVYRNRLRDGELLQADPTVQYALGAHQARLFYKDLLVESPYNTYRHKGLPPGPIGAPGRRSIEAALWPAAVPFKYFVAWPDGHHEFRATFREHGVAVAAARKAWAAQRADTATQPARSGLSPAAPRR